MLQLPECPKTVDELDGLIYALTNARFDKTPEELQIELQEYERKLRAKGKPEKIISMYLRLLENRPEDDEARTYMQRWGRTRTEAIRHYMTHFKGPCNWCVDLYTDILANHVVDRAEDEGIDLQYITNTNRLLIEANRCYLGNPALDEVSGIRLENILAHPN